MFFCCFFFNDTATTEIYTLSLHDALPICSPKATITKKEYLDEISFEKKYRRYGNQVFTKKITPKRGKLLRLSMAVEFCENPALFKKRAYHFELSDRKSTRLNSSH